jgi:tetratricopeptide (TPR) repeat protein/transcriptional regulator with XRE-family HTH domain
VAEPPVTFAGLLLRLRAGAGLTQEELAEAASVSVRSVRDLEHGRVAIPQRETVRLLADALRLAGPERAEFEAAGRSHVAPATASTRGLPRDIASFTGRQRELAELMGPVTEASDAGAVVGIHAIGGMAGIGKTAFAVHAAHRLADRFPGGQIFLPLHGHTPGQQPVDPADALASLLRTAGVAPGQIPPGLAARTTLWRDRLAGQKLLLLLDDAVSSEQVLPLLPGSGRSLVLVTSRRHLSALDDATAISLDTLPAGEAAGLLIRLAGRPTLDAGDPGVREITRLCGYLPLAIGMVARQLRHHPAWSAIGRAAELAAAVDRLELMVTENLSVAAAFDLSYADLSLDLQELFRWLGLHPGSEVDSHAAAALHGTSPAVARRGLEALYDQYLLTEVSPGRYRMHDLIREHARALADRLDPDNDRDHATARLLDYYQYAAARAGALIARQVRPGAARVGDPVTATVPDLAGAEQALAWFRAERTTLLACLDHAATTGQHSRVIALTAALAGLLRSDGPWAEAITRHETAIRAAQQHGDRLGQANALTDLGDVRRLTGDTGDNAAAPQAHRKALEIYRDLGDRLGQANALSDLGDVQADTGDYRAAAHDLEQALDIYRDLGDRLGQAVALSHLGTVRLHTADPPTAALTLDQALDIYRHLGNRFGQANTLLYLGTARRLTDDYPAAARDLEQALDIYQDIGNRLGQANTLRDLANVRWLTGDYPAAAHALEQALDIDRDIGSRLGQANDLRDLGIVRRLTGDYPAAAHALEQALDIYHDIGNRLGQANALTYLGAVQVKNSEYASALKVLEQALDIQRDIGNRLGQANALRYLGIVRRMTGNFPAAAQAAEQALGIYRDLGDRGGEAEALNETGALHRVTGDLAQAEECHRMALDLAHAIASPLGEAHALAGLGRCALATGRGSKAETLLGQALEIFQRIGAAEAPAMRAELHDLPGAPRPQ